MSNFLDGFILGVGVTIGLLLWNKHKEKKK